MNHVHERGRMLNLLLSHSFDYIPDRQFRDQLGWQVNFGPLPKDPSIVILDPQGNEFRAFPNGTTLFELNRLLP